MLFVVVLRNMNHILFNISDKLFLRDPQKTDMGQAIVRKSVEMIDIMGFEQFTFKKLSKEVETTEPTIYRYFANKQRLLHYLVDWYWTLMNFRIEYGINNITAPEEKLRICLLLLSGKKGIGSAATYVDEAALYRIVISESDKTFLTKTVDKDYKAGLLSPFRETCKKIADIVHEINPRYPFPHSLVSTAMHAASHQIFYVKHLPLLSDLKDGSKLLNDKLFIFLEGLVMGTINEIEK